MWVNSKQAAEILGVKYDALAKSVKRAEKTGKKFCTIKPNILGFSYTDGIGRGGKTLQIWIDDDLINDKNSEISRADKASAENLVNTAVRPLNFTNGESDGDIYANTRLDARDSVDIRGGNGGVFGGGLASSGARRDQEQTQINSNQRTNDGYEHKTASYGTDGGEYNGIDTRGNGGRASDGRNQKSDASDSSYAKDDERGEAKAYSDAYAGDGVYECQDNRQRGLRLQARSQECPGYDCGAVKGVGDEDTNGSQRGQILRQGQMLTDGREGGQWVFGGERLCECASHSMEYGYVRSSRTSSFPARAFAQEEENGRRAPVLDGNKEVVECEVIEDGMGTNLSGAGEANLPATLCLPQTKTDAQIRVELSKTKKGLEAQQKEMILKEYARAKAKGVKVAQFIEYINSNRMYCINLTQNKLFAWQRVYEAEGIEGLVDGRASHKQSQIEAYEVEDKLIELIYASNKRIDAASICQKLNEYLAVKDALDVDLLANTYAKRKTPITVSAVYRYVQKWRIDNPVADAVRRHGVDKARGMKQPAIGDMSWNITSINQVVEIDATSLDMICINTTLAKMLGMSEDEAKKLQKRFCIISIIDVYSHVRVYQMCESENSLAVQRCLAKYILRYGKPAVIRGDNGKAFLSDAVQSAVRELGIEYHAVTPYSGWKKPFVERNFGVLQSNFTAALAGYIGSCVAERVGLEGLYGKADKRAKKGEKTRLENLMSLEEVTALLDMYAEGTINNTAFGKNKKLPRELYDEKAEEAVYMHEYEVMALVGGIKTVKGGNKKGIQYLGDTYVFSGLFRYSQISFSINLNNISQLFVFNEKREFVGMAVSSKEGVTKEQAKAEVKLFEKELRDAQKRVEKARVAMSKDKVGAIKVSYEHLPRAKYPMPRAANNAVGEMIKTQAEKAANLIRNGQISDAMIQNASKPKKEKRSGGYVENMMRKRA